METTRGRTFLAAALIGALVGIGLGALIGGIRDDELTGWVTGGAIVGAAAGVLAAPRWWQRELRRADPYVLGLPESDRAGFMREVRRGPVPTDPERRAAAIRVMRRRADLLSESPGLLGVPGVVFWSAYGVFFAFREDWFMVALGLLNVAVAVDRLQAPHRAARRLAELRAYPDPVDTDTAQPG